MLLTLLLPRLLCLFTSKTTFKNHSFSPLGNASPAIKSPAAFVTTPVRPTITHGAETPGNFMFGTTCAAPTQPSTDIAT